MVKAFLAVFWVLGVLLCGISCKKEEAPQVRRVPIEGEIQLLNGSGIPGAADEVRKYLFVRGYNVVSVGNSPEWNYGRTIIALRSPKWAGVDSLKKDLGTDDVILLENSAKLVDVTIFIGQDIKERIHEF